MKIRDNEARKTAMWRRLIMFFCERIRYILKMTVESLEYVLRKVFFPRRHTGRLPGELRSVLVIQPGSIGDVVMSVPVYEALRKRFPEGRIDVMTLEGLDTLLSGNKNIDTLRTIPKRYWRRLFYDMSAFMRGRQVLSDIAGTSYDAAIDLAGTYDSLVVTLFCRAGMTVGPKRMIKSGIFQADSGSFYDKAVDPGRGHISRGYLNIVSILGCSADVPRAAIFVGSRAANFAEAELEARGIAPGRFAVIHPGAKWSPKRWPAEFYSRVIDMLYKEEGYRSVIVGGDDEAELLEKVRRGCGETGPLVYSGLGLRYVAALISRAALFIGNDSGPAHIAAAVGTPEAVLFGPTDPDRCAPLSDRCVILHEKISCWPCVLYYRRDRCQRGENECMRRIGPDMVFSECLRLLDRLK